MRSFRMPPAEFPEPCLPVSIVHGLDYMTDDDGRYEYYYNYLDYFWKLDSAEVRARHYLEHPGPESVSVYLPLAEFDQPKYAGILAYLQRRYQVIDTFEAEGYVVRWVAAGLSQDVRIELVRAEVRRILVRYWDPLGVRDVVNKDYDEYFTPVAAMVSAGKSESEIAAYLLAIETGAMRLPGDRDRARAVAGMLRAI